MADEKTIYKMKTPSGDPVRVEEAWKDANGELLTEKVNKADAQTITGLKTFSTLPQSSATPSDDKDLATKKYSDDLWSTRKAQEEKCYQALKTVTKDFTRTDPVYVRIGEDGEPEIHYTLTNSDVDAWFDKMGLGKASLYVYTKSGLTLTSTSYLFQDLNVRRVFFRPSGAFHRGLCWFRRSYTIEEIELPNLSESGSYHGMFNGCESLKKLNLFDMTPNTSFTEMFINCYSLPELPAFDCVNVTNYNNWAYFGKTPAATAIHLKNIKASISISPFVNLDREALLEVFGNLVDLTGSDSQTLTIGSTLGAKITDEDRAIVTNKNWILTE